MAASTAVELIAVSLEGRRALRDLRTQLGLSRATVERRARVGTDYMKHLESGHYPRLEASRLRRVVQVLQQAAARAGVGATNDAVRTGRQSGGAAREVRGEALRERSSESTMR